MRRRVAGRGCARPSAVLTSSTSALAALRPLVRVLGHGPGENVVDRCGNALAALARARRRLLQVGVDDRDVGRPGERQGSGERLEEQAAERVDVRSSVDLVAADLLGRDVVDGPHQAPVRGSRLGDALRQPEVREVCVLAAALLVEQDVGRLHVAVDEALRVRGVERVGDLRRDRHGPLRRQRALATQERLEVGPVHVPHRDEEPALGLAGLVDRDDVRVVEARGEPGFLQHPLAEPVVVRQALAQQLQRDRTLEPRVVRPVDLTHPATSGEGADLVAGDDVTRRNSSAYRHRPSRVPAG